MMKRTLKFFMGVLSIYPLAAVVAMFVKFIYIGDLFQQGGGISPSGLVYLRHVLVGEIVLLLLLVTYLVHVVLNKSLSKDRKWLWAVLLVCLNINVLPFYWYFHVFKQDDKQSCSG